jgi:hypothetical protein
MFNPCRPVSTPMNDMAEGQAECSATVEFAQIQNPLYGDFRNHPMLFALRLGQIARFIAQPTAVPIKRIVAYRR